MIVDLMAQKYPSEVKDVCRYFSHSGSFNSNLRFNKEFTAKDKELVLNLTKFSKIAGGAIELCDSEGAKSYLGANSLHDPIVVKPGQKL